MACDQHEVGGNNEERKAVRSASAGRMMQMENMGLEKSHLPIDSVIIIPEGTPVTRLAQNPTSDRR